MNDQSLADATASPAEPPTGAPDGALVSSQLTIEEVLASARRVEKVAWICLRGDLQAEFDQLRSELALLVDEHGVPLDDGEASVGEAGNRGRAAEVNERLQQVRATMRDSMWSVRFRAMPSDDWAVFVQAHWPKDGDMRPFMNRLIAECAIEPTLTLEQVEQLRAKFGARQMKKLSDQAWHANTEEDGLDVPKSLSYSPAPTQGESASS